MRIGELKYLTAETLKERKIRIDFKGKVRIILIPRSLLIILKDYCRKHKIKEGSIFPIKERETAGPEKYMDGDEKSLREGKGGSKQSVPA